MTFIIALLLGLFIGYKLRGALYIYKETRNVKFIKEIVDNILNNKDLEIIKSREEILKDRESKIAEKQIKKFGSKDDELENKIAELQLMFDERGYK